MRRVAVVVIVTVPARLMCDLAVDPFVGWRLGGWCRLVTSMIVTSMIMVVMLPKSRRRDRKDAQRNQRRADEPRGRLHEESSLPSTRLPISLESA